MTDEEVRARVLAEVEKVMKDRLAAKPMDQAMTLADMEHWVLGTGQEVQTRLMQALAQASQEAQDGEAPVGEHCGSRMQRRGPRSRRIVTEVGAIALERPYYTSRGQKLSFCKELKTGGEE